MLSLEGHLSFPSLSLLHASFVSCYFVRPPQPEPLPLLFPLGTAAKETYRRQPHGNRKLEVVRNLVH